MKANLDMFKKAFDVTYLTHTELLVFFFFHFFGYASFAQEYVKNIKNFNNIKSIGHNILFLNL